MLYSNVTFYSFRYEPGDTGYVWREVAVLPESRQAPGWHINSVAFLKNKNTMVHKPHVPQKETRPLEQDGFSQANRLVFGHASYFLHQLYLCANNFFFYHTGYVRLFPRIA